MKIRWPLVAASILALLTVDSALAKHYRHRARVTAAPAAVDVHSSFGPARIIQVRPGVFISSYDCITDDGYGRWRPCSDRK
ncbi:MAG TPA: hypothetical protein VGX95_12965 [Xanthobacteraceae bacterium]|nr:hypothetical protein [Xanthobacteraceae bacterium]